MQFLSNDVKLLILDSLDVRSHVRLEHVNLRALFPISGSFARAVRSSRRAGSSKPHIIILGHLEAVP